MGEGKEQQPCSLFCYEVLETLLTLKLTDKLGGDMGRLGLEPPDRALPLGICCFFTPNAFIAICK